MGIEDSENSMGVDKGLGDKSVKRERRLTTLSGSKDVAGLRRLECWRRIAIVESRGGGGRESGRAVGR